MCAEGSSRNPFRCKPQDYSWNPVIEDGKVGYLYERTVDKRRCEDDVRSGGMNNVDSADGNDNAEEKELQFSSMQKSQLEVLAIAAIKEHRRLIVADEAVYEEWSRASSDPAVSSALVETLQREYTARQQKSEAQQEELSKIIDALGYIPDMPPDIDN